MKQKSSKTMILWLSVLLLAVACGDNDTPTSKPEEPTKQENTTDDPAEPAGPSTPDDETSGLSPLHVEGRFLVDAKGVRHNLHGFAQTYSPWFNEQGSQWSNYDVSGCLRYNKGLINDILTAGWKMDFVRIHMDPYWSNDPDKHANGEADISAFDFNRFKTYLNIVFVPMVEYAISKGLYVVMRPPGVCPEHITVGGEYHQYLKKVWEYTVQHPKLKDNGAVLFELANEPVRITDKNDNVLWGDEGDRQMTIFMQELVDVIRPHCTNVLLIPGMQWQMLYNGFLKYPIEGKNIGFAVHCYPGWYNSGNEAEQHVEYAEFKAGWDKEILPIARKYPVVVTEMDWAPKKYSNPYTGANGQEAYRNRCSFGFAYTGTAGGTGFGANFMRICDESSNISWLLFTGPELLARYNDALPDGSTFLTDPEACPRPVYRKYLEYAQPEYSALINDPNYGMK